jgi:CHAD domain-containing protein
LEATTSLEREFKLSAPPGFRLPELTGLGRGLRAAEPELLRHVSVYWDTHDLRLVRWRCGLRHRNVDGWTAKLPAAGEGAALVRRELHFAGGPERPPAEALDRLLAMTRREPVVRLLELHTARERVRLTDAQGRELLEVASDLVAVVEGQETTRRFREVEVEFAKDCPRDVVAEVRSRLRRAGTGPPHQVAKHVRALGLAAGVEEEVALPELGPGASLEEVLRGAVARSVVAVVRHDPGVRLDEDSEDVHQMRVATRRLRSHLKSFGPLLDEEWARGLRGELRWLGTELGRVRDADVLAERLAAEAAELPPPEARAVKDLLSHLTARRGADREQLLGALRTPRYLALLEALVEASRRPQLRGEGDVPAAAALAPLLTASWKRLRKGVAALGDEPEDADLHALRIRAKHLRYAAEAPGRGRRRGVAARCGPRGAARGGLRRRYAGRARAVPRRRHAGPMARRLEEAAPR